MDKSTRQQISIDKWRDAKGKGTLNLIMRFGKTKIAHDIIQGTIEKDITRKILCIAPNVITYKNLVDNISYLNTHYSENANIIIYTINQVINILKDPLERNSICDIDLLVLDEVHRMLNGESYEAIKSLNYKWILALTGSKLNREQIQNLNELKAPIVDSIDEITAIQNNWIANSVEYNLSIELDEHDKVRYAKYSEQISETLDIFKNIYHRINQMFKTKVFDSDFSLVMSCFTGVYYKNGTYKQFIKPTILRNMVADIMGWSRDMELTSPESQRINKYWNPDNIFQRAKTFKDYVKQRNDILICNRPKINSVIEIISRNSVPTICFNESISMVDSLAEYFATKQGIAYHSAITSRYVINPETGTPYTYKDGRPKLLGQTSLKKLAIEGMKTGVYKYLFTAQSLNEGLTIENIEQVITTGGSCNSATHNQRVARGKTYDYLNPNKKCIVINLYIEDFILNGKEIKSRDKQKLIQRQKESEIIPIWVKNIDEMFVY